MWIIVFRKFPSRIDQWLNNSIKKIKFQKLRSISKSDDKWYKTKGRGKRRGEWGGEPNLKNFQILNKAKTNSNPWRGIIARLNNELLFCKKTSAAISRFGKKFSQKLATILFPEKLRKVFKHALFIHRMRTR